MTTTTSKCLASTMAATGKCDATHQVVSLTKIAQMLTSRIGRKPLLLTLAATLACLQTAMAANPNDQALITPSYGRKAKAILAERTCSKGLNSLRRRLAGATDKLREDRLEELPGLIDEQQQIIEAQQRIIDANAADQSDGEASNSNQSDGDEDRKRDLREKASAAMARATTTKEQLETEKTELEKDAKQEKESFIKKSRRAFQGANWATKGLVGAGLAAGMGGGIATAITLTKAGFKDLKDPSDGTADLPHMGGAMFGLVVFFVCYLYTMYLIFGMGKQFGLITALSGVGSALALGGMITMLVAPAASTMESYGQSLVFGNGSAVTWFFSIGWIFMALALVLTVGFLGYNKCSKQAGVQVRA